MKSGLLWRGRTSLVGALVVGLASAMHAQAPATESCAGPTYAQLDFWVGAWDVRLVKGGAVVGTNVIEKALDGCIIFEHWTDARRGAGKSLFYYHRAEQVWKQVWITDAGRVKEKRAVPAPAPDAMRFQGEIRLDDGTRRLDRTTLTPLPGGRVQQTIEQSSDGGASWLTVFDAIYSRRSGSR